MLTIICAFLFGLALWTPALAFNAGGVYLQLSDMLAPLYILFVFVERRGRFSKVSGWMVIYGLLVCASWFYVSFFNSPSNFIHFVYYFGVLFPYFVSIVDVWSSSKRSAAFMYGLVFGNLVSVFLAILQAMNSFGTFSGLRNNLNFTILDQAGRVMALMPEASSLAHLLLFSAFLLLVMRVNRGDKSSVDLPQAIFSRNLVAVIVALNLFVLVLTRSTSVLALLPLFSILYMWRLRANFGRKIIVIMLLGIIASVFLTVFLSIYGERGDTAGASAGNRFSTILAVVLWGAELDLNGVGLGNNSLIVPYVLEVQAAMGINAFKISEGINSLVFSRIFEEGVFALLSYFIVILSFLRVFRHGPSTLTNRQFAVFSIALWSFFVSFGGAGYRGLMQLWLCIPFSVLLLVELKRRKFKVHKFDG
tara:strand:- start:213 stop:1472 length:1260 start_codon:yes stop_codon:yes gene_type:complete